MKTRGWPKTSTAWIAIATVVHDVQLATAIAAFVASTALASSHARSKAMRTIRAPSIVLTATAVFVASPPLSVAGGDVTSVGWLDGGDVTAVGGADTVGGVVDVTPDGVAAAGDDGPVAAAVVGVGGACPRDEDEVAGGLAGRRVTAPGSRALVGADPCLPGSDAGASPRPGATAGGGVCAVVVADG